MIENETKVTSKLGSELLKVIFQSLPSVGGLACLPHEPTVSMTVDHGAYTDHILCSSSSLGFPGAAIAIKGSLLTVGCFLSFRTRNLEPKFLC